MPMLGRRTDEAREAKLRDQVEKAKKGRLRLIGVARTSLMGVGLSREKREEMLLAGIYLELVALNRHFDAPVDTVLNDPGLEDND
jgi:hypothetical protein